MSRLYSSFPAAVLPFLPDDLSGSLVIDGPGGIFLVIFIIVLLYRAGSGPRPPRPRGPREKRSRT